MSSLVFANVQTLSTLSSRWPLPSGGINIHQPLFEAPQKPLQSPPPTFLLVVLALVAVCTALLLLLLALVGQGCSVLRC